MALKRALITGVTGQDGSYLAALLLQKGYEVHGIRRRSSSFNTGRIDHLIQDAHSEGCRFFLHYGDVTDYSSLNRTIHIVEPDEIYNLAAQSHVAVSFEQPEYTVESDALGPLRMLEAIRSLRAWLTEQGAKPDFDVLAEGETPADDPEAAAAAVEPWADAGCTWWLETRWEMPQHTPERMRQVRERLAAGPPARKDRAP